VSSRCRIPNVRWKFGAEWLCTKSRTRAPKARNMKARGKRKARRPWSKLPKKVRGLKGRDTAVSRPFRAGALFNFCHQGRRASRLPLAFIFRAFGAVIFVQSRFLVSGTVWAKVVHYELRINLDLNEKNHSSFHRLLFGNGCFLGISESFLSGC
jgi:hypothetical protein